MDQNRPPSNFFSVLLKAVILVVLCNFAFIFVNVEALGKASLYNSIFPGRERLPFGEIRESYNLSLYNLDAMFASHILTGTEKARDEYRVFLIGDSSVWGTLLTPEETLAGQLNAGPVTACGKTVRAYNLGYPTISLTKELMILDQALEYQPDLIVWLTTLESFPLDKQFESPLVANNAERVQKLIANYHLPLDPNDPALVQPSKWDQTFVGQRRAVADLFRLQMYGALWASTGIDQVYPEEYERAQVDLEASDVFHGLRSLQGNLALGVLDDARARARSGRLTIDSAPGNSWCIASSVSIVSRTDSPLTIEECGTSKFVTSAESRLAASSKVVRVRVLLSKNRLQITLPRSTGTFLTVRSATPANDSVAFRMSTSVCRPRPSIVRK